MANGMDDRTRTDTIPFLPKCVSTQAVKPDRPGAWQANKELLGTLAQGLDVKGMVDWSVLTAIPTVWARPLLFAEALFDEKHPLHAQVRNEWRGLLGLLCFEDYNSLNLKVERVVLSQYPRTSNFVASLDALLPEPRASWDDIATIKVGEVVVGGASPKTLVYSAAEYICPKSVPWVDKDNRLTDPLVWLRTVADPKAEHAALKAWVANLKRHLDATKTPALDGIGRNHLVRRIEEWYNEIPCEESGDVRFLRDGNVLLRHGMPEPYAGIPAPAEDMRGDSSDFILASTKQGAPSVIIVYEPGWQQRELRVYRGITPAEVPYPREEAGDSLDNGRIQYKWIRPDLYFLTGKLLKMPTMEKTNVLFHADGYVPPLRKEILDFFEPNDLEDIFTWENAPGGIKVKLRLPLKSAGRTPRYAEVSKVYGPDDQLDLTLAPFIELWPNFRADDWQDYYCIAQTKARTQFDCYPHPSPTQATPWVTHTDSKLWRLNELPQALVCTWGGHDVGLVPIRQPEKLQPLTANTVWRVSVDFGTSNTSVFCQRRRDDNAMPLVFTDRCMQVTDVTDMPRRLFLYTYFFPPTDVRGMFPSHLRMLEDRGAPIPEPMADGIVQFVEPAQWSTVLESNSREIQENMKWSTDKNVRKYIATFLRHLLLMAAAEARVERVQKLELRYSYPSAFSVSMLNQMRMFWSSMAGAVRSKGARMHVAGSADVAASGDRGMQFEVAMPETESVAACKYFTNERHAVPHSRSRPQVSIDIGGGTTDVGVWLGGALAAQSSLLLGGNQLAQFAKERDEFRTALEDMLSVKVRRQMFDDHPYAVLNILLRQYGDRLTETLAQGYNVEPIFKRARTLVYVLLSGGFYYTGMLLRHLNDSGVKIDSTDVYLAGNGARLTDWVSFKDATLRAFEAMVREGAGDTVRLEQVEINDVRDPKQEVARGLVYDFGPEMTTSKPTAILGESGYRLNGKDLPWNFDVYSSYTADDGTEVDAKSELLKGSIEPPDEYVELKRYTGLFNRQADELSLEPLTDKLAHPAKVRARIQQAIAMLQRQSSEALVQPFFIEAVRQLLDQLHKEPLEA